MKVFISGALGEIGTRTVKLFLDASHSVVAFDTAPPPSAEELVENPLADNLIYIHGDARDFDQVLDAMRSCDAAINLSAMLGAGDGKVEVHNANVIMSWNVLRAAAEHGINRVSQASSINCVGAIFNANVDVDYLPMDELHPMRPDEGYGLSKQIVEIQGDAITRRFSNMRVASFRPHWCIPGTLPSPNRLVPTSKKEFQTTSFSDVLQSDDGTARKQLWGWNTYDAIARAFFLGIVSEGNGWQKGHEAFFIVSPTIGSTKDTNELVATWFPDTQVRRKFGKNEGLYDCSKAQRLLGWTHD